MTNDVIFTEKICAEGSKLGICTLNRPHALNALTLPMCAAMLAQFRAWQTDGHVRAVVINANGERAFCAGGDVAEVVRQVRSGGAHRFAYGDEFFTVEYALDLLIHTYSKPIIALAQGITMGGGVGLIAGAAFRVIGADARMAMPEIHIGLFPDVGGGFFLNKMPSRAGWLMALTGLTIHAHDAVLHGLADAIVPSAQMAGLVDALVAQAAPLTHASVHACIHGHPAIVAPKVDDAPMWQRLPEIRTLMNATDVRTVRDRLIALAQSDSWFAPPARNLAAGSPTTAHVAFEYLRRSSTLGIADVLALDLVLAKQFPRRHDFLEGVRAVLIDKDKAPKWRPPAFELVSEFDVVGHFAPTVANG